MTRTPSNATHEAPVNTGAVVHLVHTYALHPDHPNLPQCVSTRAFATAELAHAYAEDETGAVIETVPVEGASQGVTRDEQRCEVRMEDGSWEPGVILRKSTTRPGAAFIRWEGVSAWLYRRRGSGRVDEWRPVDA